MTEQNTYESMLIEADSNSDKITLELSWLNEQQRSLDCIINAHYIHIRQFREANMCYIRDIWLHHRIDALTQVLLSLEKERDTYAIQEQYLIQKRQSRLRFDMNITANCSGNTHQSQGLPCQPTPTVDFIENQQSNDNSSTSRVFMEPQSSHVQHLTQSPNLGYFRNANSRNSLRTDSTHTLQGSRVRAMSAAGLAATRRRHDQNTQRITEEVNLRRHHYRNLHI